VRRFAEAIGASDDAAARVEELASLSGPTRLRELGVPRADLAKLAAAAAERPGAKANPRPASAAELEELLVTIW
jgi:alcohol dehydrogenase class IV